MRITGGKAKGIPLKTPKNMLTRPATDGLRQAIFSSLGHTIQDTHVLDLFAGTGAYGLEALSRGAHHTTFIELNPQTLKLLNLNLQAVLKSLQNHSITTKTIKANALKPPIPPSEKFHLIFADPPYDISHSILPQLLQVIENHLAPNGSAILELPGSLPNPTSENLQHLKKLGKSSKNNPSAHILKKL